MKSGSYNAQQRHVVDDDSKIGEARRAAQNLANFHFNVETAGRVAIAASELATNLMRHAGGGELLIQVLGEDTSPTLELVALDRGPGMSDIGRCMTDGYSTGGTAGTGLGAVRRLAQDFDIFSAPGAGAIVMARFGETPALRYGVINLPLPGEIECGDAWALVEEPDGIALFVVDGLGHGSPAAEAAQAGVGAFMVQPLAQPQEVLLRATAAMSKTRGGAGACARIARDGAVSYAGIGNISGTLVTPTSSQGLASHNGTLGMPLRRIHQLEYRRPPGSWVIMHTDGLTTRWSLKDRPDLFAHHPAIVAALLYRDQSRNRDDATIVVLA
ncbi:MAG: SpoIIE family protein phosphatase [Pseudomonadota bacterium]